MNACRFDSSIIISAGCPDFNTINWIPALISGTGSFTPVNGQGATFHGHAGPGGSVQTNGNNLNFPSIIYNGPGCVCNLHLVVVKTFGSTGAVNVQDQIPPFNLIPFFSLNTAGTYDVPFTLLDTHGVPDTIQIYVQLQGVGADQIDVVGTFTHA